MLTTYILIFVLQASNGSNYPISAASAEFNSFAACQAAAAELQKQLTDKWIYTRAIMCAKKG